MKKLAKPVTGILALALVCWSSPPAAQAQLNAYNPEATNSPLTVSELFRYLEGATIAVLLHEIGHAVIDVYDLPIVASEEDAADEFATLLLYQMSFVSGDGRTLAVSFVDFFQTYMREKQRDEDDTLLQSAYADEHDLAERRAFKVLCNTYAAFAHAEQQAPGLFSEDEEYQKLLIDYRDLLGSLGADDRRIRRCETDFARSLESWSRFLGPWERGQAGEQEILHRSLAGLENDPAEPRFRVTYAATPLDRIIEPFETVGPPVGLFDKPDFRLHASERLRYYLPAYLAKLISARFRLPDGGEGRGIGGSVDIYSRRCGDDNAFYVKALRSLTLCHEIIDASADAYIRHRAGTDPASWWIARHNDSYGIVERSLVGEWLDADGARLSLAEHGLYTLRGNRADGGAPRHGYWGVDGQELWLIEVYREGSTCFNPACRSNFAEGGFLPEELASLSQGGIPSGELRGTFAIHPCKIEETRLKSEKPDPSDLGLIMFQDRPCEGEDPEDIVPGIAIGGAVFTPAPMQVLRDLPGVSSDDGPSPGSN